MHSPLTNRSLPLALAAGFLGLGNDLPAQVTEWGFFKGAIYEQETANTMPTTPWLWEAGVWVTTSSTGDAGLITLSGGNISGSIPFEQDGDEWFLDRDYQNQAAMNAELPSNATYTLTMSGGTLGLQIQTFVVGPQQYPTTPYLTGLSFNTLQQFPVGAATTLTWNSPGPLVQASGLTGLTIEDRTGNELFTSLTTGAQTSTTIPANSLTANACHKGYIDFAIITTPPAGGFGIPGLVAHVSSTDLEIRTWPFPTAPCARQDTYGMGCAGLEIQSSDPILGSSWTLSTFGISQVTPVAFTYFALAPQTPSLPLSALGLGAPGCSLYIDPVSIITNLGGFAPGGQLNITIPLPPSQVLGGTRFYAQTIALASFTPLGLSSSNVIEAMLGN